MPVWSEEQLCTCPVTADPQWLLCPPRAAASAWPWRAQVGDAERPGMPGGPNRTAPPHPPPCALIAF